MHFFLIFQINEQVIFKFKFQVIVQKQFPAVPENYYPVQLLNYMVPGTQFTETVISEKLPCFQVKCEVGGFQFTAEGRYSN